jgi:putative oxygen-independent coproporphyrinogen III oxidase
MNLEFISKINSNFTHSYPISIYIHWPFCFSKCPYCDFNSHVAKTIDHHQWLNSYIKELQTFLPFFQNRKIRSIYFGGGTPSLMEPFVIKNIIDFLKQHVVFDDQIEITLEANPTSSEYKKFFDFRESGINRVSIGVQSLIEKDLKFLGRNHDANEAIKTIKHAQEIFPRYSFDLIYSRPEQTLDDWQNELELALTLAKDHISLYQLTIEKGTKFFSMYKKNAFKMPSDDLSNEFYFLTDRILNNHGFESYEVSNYSKNNAISLHNMCYWQYDDYLGIGPGAHSRLRNDFLQHYSFHNIYNPNNWLEATQNQYHAIQNFHHLTKREILEEILIMGLRIKNGISQKKSIEKLGEKIENFFNKKTIEFLKNENLVQIDDSNFSTTERGFRLMDYIVKKLYENLSDEICKKF